MGILSQVVKLAASIALNRAFFFLAGLCEGFNVKDGGPLVYVWSIPMQTYKYIYTGSNQTLNLNLGTIK